MVISEQILKDLTSKEEQIIVIAGPTCSGKTSLSLDLAKELNCEIINADSRLIFDEMNIGTAKPELLEPNKDFVRGDLLTPYAEKETKINHYLVNICKANQEYSSGEYQKDFDTVCESLNRRGAKRIIVVGGSGMYLRAALENLNMPGCSSDIALREELSQKDLKDLVSELETLDPGSLSLVDLNNKRRVIRALEVCKITGGKFSELRLIDTEDRYKAIWYAVSGGEREVLYERINKRVVDMLDQGLLAEVQSLLEKYGPTKTLLNTIGYGEIVSHLQDDLSLDEAVALIQKKTRNYAKRQMTWFRANPRIKWLK